MMENKQKDYLFVLIQILLFIIYWWQPKPIKEILPSFWKFAGILIVIIGWVLILIAFVQLNRNLTMLPSPVKNSKLITTGVFKYIRHPIYTGIFLFALGWAMFKYNFDQLIISLLILLLFEIKSNYEEKKLKDRFPEYDKYKDNTGKFFPFK